MKVKILNKFDYQTFPVDDTSIEVSDEVLEQIGKTKCFDIFNNCVIDYDNSKENHHRYIIMQIDALKEHLKDTDYQAIKYAEGELTESEYAPMKQQRKAWREEIRELEEQLDAN